MLRAVLTCLALNHAAWAWALNLPPACEDQVVCKAIKDTFSRSHVPSFFRSNSSVALWDTNSNMEVDVNEFFTALKGYGRMAFTVVDSNKDGSLANEAGAGNLLKKFSLEFFHKILTIVFDYLDSNKNNIVEQSDAFIDRREDRNKDGKVTLAELFRISSLYNMPGPLYNLYSRIDRNTDERLTREEAEDFLRRLFALADSNSDCYVTAGEVTALLGGVGVSWDYQLAATIMMDQYLAIGRAIAKIVIERADTDMDNRVTFEELFSFGDLGFLKSLSKPIRGLNDHFRFRHPFEAFTYKITRWSTREEDEEVAAMWLTALQNLMYKPVLVGPAQGTCSTGS